MKRCPRCKEVKEDSEFYADKRTPTGLKSQCKSFHIEGNIRTRDKENARNINRDYARRARAKEPEKFREREREASRKRPWTEKQEARYLLNRAVRRGEVMKPDLCEGCNKEKKLTGHHKDYSKPLEVEWLCYECHGIETRKMNASAV